MTGYGKGQITFSNFEITAEIKSVNNRYIDIIFRAPSIVSSFEPALRKLVKDNVNRGKVNVYIEIKSAAQKAGQSTINEDKLNSVYANLKSLKEKLNLNEEIELRHLLSFPELFETDISSVDEKELMKNLTRALTIALDKFNGMRLEEGTHLVEDMTLRINIIETATKAIHIKAPLNVTMEFEKLNTRIAELLVNTKVNEERLEQEIALISDKVDITEELTRMESHINQFRKTLARDSELGKKLTFILQEMHREANTMNSKTTDLEISHNVIQIKEEIEKIREQTQNIE